ncbi:unnamed protein product [Prunus armeniaca]
MVTHKGWGSSRPVYTINTSLEKEAVKKEGESFQLNILVGKFAHTTMEVYVDDKLVKASQRVDHIKNLAEAFSLLRKYNMKLNSSQCIFGVSSGQFLGYLATQRGTEAHLNQIKVILNMKSPSMTN